jgi:Fe-S oxidoreductase
VDLPNAEECCGFGGVMSVEHPELSAEWLKRKISNFEASQSPTLVVTDAGCLMHIAGGMHRLGKKRQVIHIAEVLNQR